MNYKKEIIKMIQELDNDNYLMKIYYYVLSKYTRNRKTKRV